MRTIKILIFCLLFFSCKKERLIKTLPPITSSGQNSLGFLVEENTWVPNWEKYSWGESCKELSVEYLAFNNQLEISGGIKIKDKRSYFRIFIDSLYTSGIISPKWWRLSISDSKGMFIPNGGDYDNICGANSSCNLTITKFDTTNKIVSGIFQTRLRKVLITGIDMQDIYPNSPEYIEIKEGRFDVKFNYCR